MPRPIGRAPGTASGASRLRIEAPRVKDHRDGAREVQTGHALAHGNRDLSVRCCEDLRAEPAPLRPKRQDRALGQGAGPKRLAVRMQPNERTIALSRQLIDARYRQSEMQT